MSWRTLAIVVALLGPGCSVPNPNHCGNLDGDATCKARDPARPHCSLCVGANDGCLAGPVDPACGGAGSTTASPTGEPGTTVTSAPGTSTTAGTGTTTGATTGTSSSTGPGPTTDASTGAGTTTGDMTSGTASTGDTTAAGPMCGDGELEGMEACDTDQFGGKTCLDFGPDYGGGALKCAGNCTIDISSCCKIKGKPCIKGSDCCSGNCFPFICQ